MGKFLFCLGIEDDFDTDDQGSMEFSDYSSEGQERMSHRNEGYERVETDYMFNSKKVRSCIALHRVFSFAHSETTLYSNQLCVDRPGMCQYNRGFHRGICDLYNLRVALYPEYTKSRREFIETPRNESLKCM